MFDVIVIGAGPAGAAAARLLTTWGRRVALIDHSRHPRHASVAAESIPPSARQLMVTIGAVSVVDDPAVQPWRGNAVWWGDAPKRVETFPPGVAGQQVLRDHFARQLRTLAVESGAECLTALARDVLVAGLSVDTNADESTVVLEDATGSRTITAPYVLDCSGRSGVIARQGLRRDAGAPRTIALSAVWRRADGWPECDASHTLIASHDEGWAWSIAPSPDVRHFTVMVDPSRTDLARGAAAEEIYRRELDKVTPFRSLLAGATIAGRPWGADATAYDAVRYAGERFLLVGDAGSSLDPLSSFGVKKALASGWLAAIAVHTALERPPMVREAFAFFERRERQMRAVSAEAARAFAAGAGDASALPFWSVRAALEGASDHTDEDDPRGLARDPGVLAAFEDLKRRRSLQIRPSAVLRVEGRPAVRGREIVLDDHLVVPAWPDGVRYLRGIDLLALTRMAPAHRDAGELFEAVMRAHPAAALPDVVGALAVLLARGVLEHAPR